MDVASPCKQNIGKSDDSTQRAKYPPLWKLSHFHMLELLDWTCYLVPLHEAGTGQ